jgi:hypothetical protein
MEDIMQIFIFTIFWTEKLPDVDLVASQEKTIEENTTARGALVMIEEWMKLGFWVDSNTVVRPYKITYKKKE